MSTYNRATLIGNLGAAPETRFMNNDKAVCNFRIATSKKWKDKDGNLQEKTEWHRIVVFGKQAEACGEYLKKGSKVHVDGELETREWEDRDGVKRYTTEVKAMNVLFLTPRSSTSRAPEPPPMSDEAIPY